MTDPIDPQRSGEEGNTITLPQSPPACKWCITWNNYPEDWISSMEPILKLCKGYVLGKEIAPTTGTPHIQGFLDFKTKTRWTPFKDIGISKWIKAKGSVKSNVIYCSKSNDVISYGTCKIEMPYKEEIPEMYEWQKELIRILEQPRDNRTIYWLWEEMGCRGKTCMQKWIYTHMEKVCALSGKASDMKNGIIQYQEKNSYLPEIVLMNIPRCQDTDHVSWQGIEEIKDMFFFSGKYEGGMVCGPSPHVVIFSNEAPPLHKLSADRWKVWKLSS